MLGVIDQQQVVVPQWELLEQRTCLPTAVEDYFDREGLMPVKPDSRRGYHRMYLRMRAVISYEGAFIAGYVSDISRSGMGLLMPGQLLPLSRVSVYMADGRQILLRIRNCIRVGESCYRCGGEYAPQETPPRTGRSARQS